VSGLHSGQQFPQVVPIVDQAAQLIVVALGRFRHVTSPEVSYLPFRILDQLLRMGDNVQAWHAIQRAGSEIFFRRDAM
jgi:hypothetical protein